MIVTTSQAQERARTARKNNDGPRRRELIRAAGACFAELGYDRTTVEVITSRADVSRATFYAYFSSRDEMFHAVADEVCEEFLESQHVEGPASEDLREVLRTTTKAFVEAVYANGRVLELIEHRARLDPEVGRTWSAVQTRLIRRYTRFIERINESFDVVPCASPARIAQTLADAQLAGAARLVDATPRERRRYTSDVTAISERLIGFI
ncbi:TetR/AcrR family transcriptional regulator [Rhodococcus sp. NPDC019627]|uniref:TetR/AcrR family transcriptional regulator n=1 Tax=unclassified Rhodococcus (in: high G+C Gram-positive bacteria) TaxID=192944 RepID=UPI0033DAF76B